MTVLSIATLVFFDRKDAERMMQPTNGKFLVCLLQACMVWFDSCC